MIDNQDQNAKLDSTSEKLSSAGDFEQSLLNLNVYKELDEIPNQNLDLLAHVKNQLQQLDLIHKRKMFLIKEISAVRIK